MKNLLTQILIFITSFAGVIYCLVHIKENILLTPISTIITLLGIIGLTINEDND